MSNILVSMTARTPSGPEVTVIVEEGCGYFYVRRLDGYQLSAGPHQHMYAHLGLAIEQAGFEIKMLAAGIVS